MKTGKRELVIGLRLCEATVVLGRCPYQGCTHEHLPALVATFGGEAYQVLCKGCGMMGPERFTANEAGLAWDGLPRVEGTVMVSVCSGCKKVVDLKDGRGVAGLSHGLCKGCAKRIYGIDLDGEKEEAGNVEHSTPNVQRPMGDGEREAMNTEAVA